jgi:hypothetical protein
MFKAMFGRGAQRAEYMPPHIEEIDHIICTTPKDMKIILIKFYTTGGTVQDKAIVLGMDRHTLRRRLDRSEWYVNSRLDGFVEFEPIAPAAPKEYILAQNEVCRPYADQKAVPRHLAVVK